MPKIDVCKYSVLMPYYARAEQLRRTLVSFAHHYEYRCDYEVIVVEDRKNDDQLTSVVVEFARLPVRVIRSKWPEACYNPAPSFNEAARAARGFYLVLTNPECFHASDVLAGLDVEFAADPDVYVVCACESGVACEMRDGGFASFRYRHHMWYHKSTDRDTRYHFCSALSAENYRMLGGFDEGYADGIAYDDDDFRDRVIAAGVRFVSRDDLVVVHQEHRRSHQQMSRQLYDRLLTHNKRLYDQRRRERLAVASQETRSV